MMNEPVRIEDLRHGCYVDGIYGFYAGSRMIQLAASYGFPVTHEEYANIIYDEANGDGMTLEKWADGAEEWLNTHASDDESAWGWRDGEFFYQSLDWWKADT